MYARTLNPPNHSFFLFGPRATGKSTWLRKHFSSALWFNLLLNEQYLDLLKDKKLFRRTVEGSSSKWVVVDEVQKLPELLNEIHDLIAIHGEKYSFAISGSSARKLRSGGVNLLAGRAITRNFFPLTSKELQFEISIEEVLKYGMLPDVHVKKEIRDDILKSYVTTYLREEIQQEALTRSLDSFSRFLFVAALSNSETINVAGISRESGVSRSTCQNYFDILVDTLVAYLLPAWKPQAKVREIGKPKFYIFDCGVVNALAGDMSLHQRGESVRGKLLETFILSELRAYNEYVSRDMQLYYWRDSSGKEIDFIVRNGKQTIGIEVKSSTKWKKEFAKNLFQIPLDKKILIYLGDNVQIYKDIQVMPVLHFLKEMYKGEIFT